ncbi:MAG: biotin--[acetyl-CoA-carboxylase] ligase [Desulfurococcaceae archaeon]
MVQSLLNLEKSLFIKLEILRIMSSRESVDLSELAGELGLYEWELVELVNELKNNYMIVQDKSRVLWFAGDNPSRIKPWGWNYSYKLITGSTMIRAKYSPVWSIIVSEWQYGGYGRHGRTWISNLGGLWMTLKLEVSPRTAQILPMIVPIVICRFLQEKLGVKAGIKWPNDIIVRNRKLSGFLIEGEVLLSKVIAYLGIGINVNNEPPLETATSLKYILNKLVPRNSIIAYIAGTLNKVEGLGEYTQKVQMEYLELLETLGLRVKVVTRSGTYIGIAKSVTENGDLLVETGSGSYRFSSGEVLELRHIE